MNRRSFSSLIAVLLAFVLATPTTASAQTSAKRLVVVELFTSQGCNSCPPADAYLGRLAVRPDIVALSFHVDYWDYIGWKDPFAQAAFTARQRDYSRALAQRYVYTPQMVVDGRLQGVGSEKSTINGLITQAARQRGSEAANRPSLRLDGDTVRIEGGKVDPAASAIVWLAVFEPEHKTAVRRGENAGRNLGNYNVVREMRVLGRYKGEAVALPLNLDPAMAGKGCAIVVQSELPSGPGPVLASLAVDPR